MSICFCVIVNPHITSIVPFCNPPFLSKNSINQPSIFSFGIITWLKSIKLRPLTCHSVNSAIVNDLCFLTTISAGNNVHNIALTWCIFLLCNILVSGFNLKTSIFLCAIAYTSLCVNSTLREGLVEPEVELIKNISSSDTSLI